MPRLPLYCILLFSLLLPAVQAVDYPPSTVGMELVQVSEHGYYVKGMPV